MASLVTAPPSTLLLPLSLLLLLGCQPDAPSTKTPATASAEKPVVKFVRDGVVLPHGKGSSALIGLAWSAMRPQGALSLGPQHGLFVPWQATPGDQVFTKVQGQVAIGTAPMNPSPLPFMPVPLGDIRQEVLRGNLPDSCVALAGTSVAVGTFTGHLIGRQILEDAAPVSKALVTGGMIKSVAFSREPAMRPFPPDGSYQPPVVFAGEQSTRGRFHALTWPALTPLWQMEISKDLGEGRLPDATNPYGIYSLPAIFQITSREDGVYFVGVHSQILPDGTKRNLSRLYAYTNEGERRWVWPADAPAPVNILRFDVEGPHLLLGASRSFETQPIPEWPDRQLIVLDRSSGRQVSQATIPALAGFQDAPFIWQGLSLAPGGNRGVIGLSDGRGILLTLLQDRLVLRQTLDLGTPIEIGGLQLTSPVAYAICTETTAFLHTGGSNIPPGGSTSATTPPSPHPGANTLTAIDLASGEVQWQHREASGFNGLATDGLGRWLVTTTGNPTYADQSGAYSVLVFDTYRTGAATDKIVFKQPLQGAPFFNFAISADGFFIAVTETPLATPDGVNIEGVWQTHVWH